MQIPFRLKSRAFRLLSYLPAGALYFVQRHITKRSKVRIQEISPGWTFHAESVRQSGAKVLIEFGAGKTLAQNLYLSRDLKSQTVVDLFPMLDLTMLNEAVSQLRELAVPLDPSKVESLEQLKKIHRIEYLAPFDMEKTGLRDESIDICVSTNTLEHIPKESIVRIFSELHRILAADGQVSAMIDYSDHYAHSDPSISRLHYLHFSEQAYKAHNHSNHFQNRMRHEHYGAIFKAAGFTVLFEEATNYCDADKANFRSELLTGSDTDFATTGFWRLGKITQ